MSLTLALYLYLLFAVPAVLLGLPAWRLRRSQLHLGGADGLLLIVPWATWLVLMLNDTRLKTLSNLVEASAVGVATGVTFAVRAWAAGHVQRPQSHLALMALAASTTAAVAIWWFVPALPE